MVTTETQLPAKQMPSDANGALGHLVTHHGWEPRLAEESMIQAHRYAHGLDGRPDLADEELDHTHKVAPVAPRPPSVGRALKDPAERTAEAAEKIHWWVRLFGVVWLATIAIGVIAVVAMVAMAALGSNVEEKFDRVNGSLMPYSECLAKGYGATYCYSNSD